MEVYGIYLASPNAEWGGDKMVSGKRDGTASHDMMQYDMIPYRLG